MTLRFIDSCSHYNSAQMLRKWDSAAGSFVIGAASGRFAGQGALTSSTGGSTITKLLDAQATWIVGFAFYQSAFNTGPSLSILRFLDGASTQCEIRQDAVGLLYVYNAAGAQIAGPSSVSLKLAAWPYLEVKATIGPAGSVVIKMNGTTILSAVGINTRSTANSSATQVQLGNGGFVDSRFTDIVMCDGNGAINNDFLGDCRVQALLPTGAGNYTEWDGLTGAATHWQAVNENPATDDTTYVSDTLAVAGHRDTYAMADATPTSGTVPGIQVVLQARKDDAGVRTIAAMVRSGAADAVGANVNLSAAFVMYPTVFELDPGAAAWTIAKVNALEAGQKAVA